MTSAISDDLCRITVNGPDKRVDLVVPSSTTVAALLPVLLWHTVELNASDGHRPDGTWVLQRLGGRPFDPTGTPESLDWLEGEEFHLRPAAEPLPELDFDDLADGIATTVNKRPDRWQPHYRRYLFLALSQLALALLTATVVAGYAGAALAGVGFGLAGLLAAAAVVAGRQAGDAGLPFVFATSAYGCAAVVALTLADGVAGAPSLREPGLAMAAVAGLAVAAPLVVVQRLWARALPYPVLLGLLVVAAETVVITWLHRTFGLSWPGAAGLSASVLFGVVVFAPKIVLRSAHLRGPQLPKTGEELQFDTEPHEADDVHRRANDADRYLSVATVTAAVVLSVLFWLAMAEPGWAGWLFVLVLASALLLRARAFLGVWQRVSLTAAGATGMILVIVHWSRTATPGRLIVILCGLALLVAAFVMAALRPWPRRLLPVWEFTATILDVATGLAVLPIALQLLHTYAWARGLVG
ncbi:type VII secretion integral membrane protein EccD [Couchioplanes caeruleus]|uniref:Type VII secretion integral membrane protein EccD n=2 Tax=Couchioplanes caeruleus TaxID=56438 RepID=A0A1K0GRY6_9ACTN|nr:type VII secretion integral membrane protein EccD [Couchioplanes caeruleus]OJF12035.1 type VII secretion integral membrane protein EccD [Couchioplanes caeruleus subsp. caeruleus]ROP29855.1 type VII secretion integral membrane protein EccD [Couchioplanes caeruleus]